VRFESSRGGTPRRSVTREATSPVLATCLIHMRIHLRTGRAAAARLVGGPRPQPTPHAGPDATGANSFKAGRPLVDVTSSWLLLAQVRGGALEHHGMLGAEVVGGSVEHGGGPAHKRRLHHGGRAGDVAARDDLVYEVIGCRGIDCGDGIHGLARGCHKDE
jgi:hypothetical protein